MATVGKHFPCGYSMSTNWTFDCRKKFCESLRDHAMKIINFEKKKMMPLTKYMKDYNKNKKSY